MKTKHLPYRGADVTLTQLPNGLLIVVTSAGVEFRLETGCNWTVGWIIDVMHQVVQQLQTGDGRFTNFLDYIWE
jgi:hypothetical protein